MNYLSFKIHLFLFLIISTASTSISHALEIEPRKWSHLPIGTSFIGSAIVLTEADIFFDPTLSLEDVELDLDTLAVKYIHSFELFNKSARIDLTQAYQEGKWTGLLEGEPASTTRNGPSDTFVRLAVNLMGSPPLKGKQFRQYRQSAQNETIVGAAVVLRLPTGDYKKDRLVNLGQNRFAIRPQLGVVHTSGKWAYEITGEVAFYENNNEFFNGNKLEQDPLFATHAHITRSLSPGEWFGISIGSDYGGEFTLNGVEKDDKRHNIGWAVSYSFPINKQSGIKIGYIGTRTEESTGFDSESLALGIAYAW